MACEDDPQPWMPNYGLSQGSGGSGGDASGSGGSTGPSGPGPGAGGFNEGGQPPAPMFDLACGDQTCAQGQACCWQGGLPVGCDDPALCGGEPLGCDDEDDCNAGGGPPEICCAVYEGDTFARTECTSKGGCSGPGLTIVCPDTDYCDECIPAEGMPAGMQTCGPPP